VNLTQDIHHSARVCVCFSGSLAPKGYPPKKNQAAATGKMGWKHPKFRSAKKNQGAKAAPGLSQVSGVFSGHFCLVGKSKKTKKSYGGWWEKMVS